MQKSDGQQGGKYIRRPGWQMVWLCQMEKYRDYDKFVKCSKCELKAWCRGCPAVANGAAGNFYGADPQCWKTRNEITGEVLSC